MDRARILIADEDFVLSRTLTWLLREQGYDVAVAPGGRGVMDHLKVTSPDLLMIDVGDEPTRRLPAARAHARRGAVAGHARARDVAAGVRRDVDAGAEVRRHGLSQQAVPRARAARARAHAAPCAPRDPARAPRARTPRKSSSRRCAREAEKRRQLVDILQEVHGDFSPEELYHILTRRVAHALDISHCSLILARPGDDRRHRGGARTRRRGCATSRSSSSAIRRFAAALETSEPVLVEDVRDEPAVRGGARGVEDRAQRCDRCAR